MAGLKRRA
uniref:Death effector domain-containing n=2 Tax=Muroidea TaxID=337687 RepID=A0A8C6R8M4_NANGA